MSEQRTEAAPESTADSVPFKKGMKIDLNGRVFAVHKLTRKDLVLRVAVGEKSVGELKPLLPGQVFEWLGWSFRVRKLESGSVYCRPFVHVEPAARAVGVLPPPAGSNGGGLPGARGGFVIDKLPVPVGFDASAPGAFGPGGIEAFVGRILDALERPQTQNPQLLNAWVAGVQAFFEGRKEEDCPWNDSPLITLEEPEQQRAARLALSHYWKTGWRQAMEAASAAYEDLKLAETHR